MLAQMGTMCVWGVKVYRSPGKPPLLRNRSSPVAAELMHIDGTFKE